MDASQPIRAVIPTLEGPVLMALAGTTQAMSGRQIAALVGASHRGVTLALRRLTVQGLVNVAAHAPALLYTANREHVAWPAIDLLTGLRRAVICRIRNCLRQWELAPHTALLYGSFARGDGDVASDIDVLVIRPTGLEDDPRWDEQKNVLRTLVEASTGNDCQILDIDYPRLRAHVAADDPLVEHWLRDGIALAGPPLSTVLRRGGAQ